MGLFGKKNDAADGDDSNRSALFGSRSKNNKSSAPPTNPYTQPPPQSGNPYASAPSDPYAAAKQKAYSSPDPYSAGSNQNQGGQGGDTKTPAYTGTMSGGGYGNNRYGNQAGYGSDRFGNQGGHGQGGGSRYGAGGYGGLGSSNHASKPDDEDRSALFGGAQERVQQKQQQTPGGYGGAPPPYDNGSQGGAYGGQPGGYPGSAGVYGGSGGYQPGPKYDDRRLTAEEEEEEEVNSTKQQIRFIKQEDVASTRNALRIAQQAEEVGRDTLARLGAQGEHIHNTQKNLDLAHNQNKIAEEKARELKTLNRSMWAVHVGNPFGAKSREERRDREVMEKHQDERAEREATRRAAYLADQRMQKNFKDLDSNDPKKREKNLAERAKYQFEADSEDDEMENEIDNNLDALAGVTSRLNMLARVTGDEVDLQNKKLDEVSRKGDQVDVEIAANRAKLDRIR